MVPWRCSITPRTPTEVFVADDPLCGMWRNREDMADVAGYVRKLRASRFDDDGSRREA